ncbi:MlaD family protein [Ralstonia pseudosolanacearum]|uniref:MCE family protein n=1 Tax=Ralstonia solanacearum TaxID=305 RepID=A0A0S4TM53_RALSL|nr:MlaD family protein [Ralstonia pseudosolanacearum]OAI78911.1 ABC transporter permease [Ralstonia solanacearum]QCX50462.1 MCE family protein [Ralstonia pseudosolanacearum]CUV11159.1 putative ABC-type transporter, periplasmic component (Resistance to organic solvents) [Ralstonia solanacearum]
MENRAHAFLAGLFTIGLAIFIALAVVWFNRDQTVRVPYEVVTRSTVNGLSPQAAVKYRGLDVGKVDSIRFDDKVPGQIIVRVLVDKDAPITTTTYGRLAYQGVTGLAYVQFDDRGYDGGRREVNRTRLETSNQHPARIAMEAGFLDELDKRGDQMLARIDQTLSSLSALFDDEHRQALMAAMRSFQGTMDSYNALARQAEPTMRRLPQIAANLDATLSATRGLSQSLSDPKGPLMGTLASAGNDLSSASQSMQAATNVLANETLPQLNGFTREARQAVRSFDHAVTDFNTRPQSVLFGPAPATPGPGETGFAAPQVSAAPSVAVPATARP